MQSLVSQNFNYAYANLLKTLHLTFNGQLASALGLMQSAKEQSMELMMLITLSDGPMLGRALSTNPSIGSNVK